MTSSEILTDWKFWSLLVSISALILSQLPPIHILLRKAKLDLEVFSRIYINHKIGNPNLQMHLILRNLGGKSVRIKKIYAKVFRDGKEIMKLPAQTYISNPKDNQHVLLTSFMLEPDEEWSKMTSFLNYFDRNEEREYRTAELNIRNEIFRLQTENPESKPVHASENFVKPFNELFDKKFQWLAGDYIIEVIIESDDQNIMVEKKYRFTIFESLRNDFIKHKEGFSTGAGIYWDSPEYTGSWIEIEEKNS